MTPYRKEFEDALTRWIKAQKEYPSLDHGPQPNPKDYGFKTFHELWEASKIIDRVKREMAREK